MSCRLSASSGSSVRTSSHAPWSSTSCSVHVPGAFAFPATQVNELPDLNGIVGDRLLRLGHELLRSVYAGTRLTEPRPADTLWTGERHVDDGSPARPTPTAACATRGRPGHPHAVEMPARACR